MPVRVRVLAVVCVLLILVLIFAVFFVHNRNRIKDLDTQTADALSYQQYLELKESTLQDTLSIMGTDAFIESQAREKYGYMKSDEIRFVINDPETLYGTQNQEDE